MRGSAGVACLAVAVAAACLRGAGADLPSPFASCPLRPGVLESGRLETLLGDHDIAARPADLPAEHEESGPDAGDEAGSSGSGPFDAYLGAASRLLSRVIAGLTAGTQPDECEMTGVIGQHIALQIVPPAIHAHLTSPNPEKPLVFFLYGSPGIGKTFFETNLRRHLFKHADKDGWSDGVLAISGLDYADPKRVQESRRALLHKVEAQVSACPTSMVVIDEAQLAASGVFECLVDVLGFRQPVEAATAPVDYRRSIFVFTTNTGAGAVDGMVAQLLRSKRREELVYEDFQSNLRQVMQGISQWLAFKHRVDFYVPFLPMTRAEVCIFIQRALQSYTCTHVRKGSFPELVWTEAVVDHVADAVMASFQPAEGSDGDDGSAPLPEFAMDGLSTIRGNHLFLQVFDPIRRALDRHKRHRVTAVELGVVGGKVTVRVDTAPPPHQQPHEAL